MASGSTRSRPGPFPGPFDRSGGERVFGADPDLFAVEGDGEEVDGAGTRGAQLGGITFFAGLLQGFAAIGAL